ncbi:MAG: methyltransferase domain-containing protein [Xanthomonadales bacterium]|nr:methyltransferase domain-containing protein [Xanthomonadales bacterium]
MSTRSKCVSSAQTQPHAQLAAVVQKHLDTAWRQPLRASSEAAFARFAAWYAAGDGAPWILDSGCGTGASTLQLARRYPQHRVLGIDQSAVRLAVGERALKATDAPRNAFLLRCEAADFWRLALAAGLHPARHYLLYPNPWPKAAHLRSRWHAHPAFTQLLALGGELELRSNWEVYAREFALALQVARISASITRIEVDDPVSPFERKYAASGHGIWQVTATIGLPSV